MDMEQDNDVTPGSLASEVSELWEQMGSDGTDPPMPELPENQPSLDSSESTSSPDEEPDVTATDVKVPETADPPEFEPLDNQQQQDQPAVEDAQPQEAERDVTAPPPESDPEAAEPPNDRQPESQPLETEGESAEAEGKAIGPRGMAAQKPPDSAGTPPLPVYEISPQNDPELGFETDSEIQSPEPLGFESPGGFERNAKTSGTERQQAVNVNLQLPDDFGDSLRSHIAPQMEQFQTAVMGRAGDMIEEQSVLAGLAGIPE